MSIEGNKFFGYDFFGQNQPSKSCNIETMDEQKIK